MGTRIGIIIPNRGDRPEFLKNCLQMIAAQTIAPKKTMVIGTGRTPIPLGLLLPYDIKVVAPVDGVVDITRRYREGYQLFDKTKFDILFFMEDDDYYAPDYLEVMLKQWEKAGRPDLFGTNYTIYYHLKLKKYFTMRHEQRSSAMSTLIRPGLNITWPLDHDPYTDQWLWMSEDIGIKTKKVFEPNHIICVGMKHGQGLCGGGNHVDGFYRYINDDNGFLENTLDEESYQFYKQYSDKLQSDEKLAK
jgi:glycosyltransferase involved in cell wall biosynthesis